VHQFLAGFIKPFYDLQKNDIILAHGYLLLPTRALTVDSIINSERISLSFLIVMTLEVYRIYLLWSTGCASIMRLLGKSYH
jgi:hypothetical protein